MEGLFERINITREWFQETVKEQSYIELVNKYTHLAAEFYKTVHSESKIYYDVLQFGCYTYLNMTIVYRPDTDKYYLFEYCVDSMQCWDEAGPNGWNAIFDDAIDNVQIIMDRRSSFNTEDLLEYIS